MKAAVFSHQFRTLIRPRRLVGLSLLAAVPGLILLVVGLAGQDPEAAEIVSGIGSTTYPIAALIVAAATWRDERDGGTLPYLYLKPIPRLSLAGISVGAAVAATSLIGAIAALAVAIGAVVAGAGATAGLTALPMYFGAAVGYSAVFVPLGYLVPRVILTGLAYVIVWEQIVARLVTGVANTSVWRFALSIYADLGPDVSPGLREMLGPVTAGVWGGMAKLGLVGVIGVAALTWALRRRDAV